ncbi:MAG: phosphoserine transaminase [Acidimicrobiia bacterium]|nr:phosphoserine transaminase [Acidimicrobiia bacterium]
MTDLPDIRLPADMIPSDGRFGSGPSKVLAPSLNSLAETGASLMGTSHRRPAVRGVVAEVQDGLRNLYDLPDDYEVLLGNGGATAFWDAAAFSLIENRSQHLSIGEFSSKFVKVTSGAPHLADPDVIEADYGQGAELRADSNIDAYATIHNETSTGVKLAVTRPDSDGLVLVDATSAAGAVSVDHGEYDVYYFSPQKAFGSDGGLFVAICSPAAVERIEALAESERWIPPFLDLKTALDNSRKNQTNNTPAIATMYLLARQIEMMLIKGGLGWAIKRSEASSATLYDWAEASDIASPFVTDPDLRSTTTVTIDLVDNIDADTVEGVLRANGIVDTFGYRKLGRNQLRVACFPNVEPADVAMLTAAIDYVAEQV